jgi:hypothetical protein
MYTNRCLENHPELVLGLFQEPFLDKRRLKLNRPECSLPMSTQIACYDYGTICCLHINVQVFSVLTNQ